MLVMDFTNFKIDVDSGVYKQRTEVCPACNRIGIQFLEYDPDMYLHVISSEDWGIFIHDFCNVAKNTWTATDYAKSMAHRVKTIWEQQNENS